MEEGICPLSVFFYSFKALIVMDKIIWLDGHTSSIASHEAFSKQYSENNKWYMNHADSTFVWMGNCWMEI